MNLVSLWAGWQRVTQGEAGAALTVQLWLAQPQLPARDARAPCLTMPVLASHSSHQPQLTPCCRESGIYTDRWCWDRKEWF